MEYERLVKKAMGMGADFCDVRVVTSDGFRLNLLQSQTRDMASSTSSGAGIRVLLGGAWGFASTSKLTDTALEDCCTIAVKLAKNCASRVKQADKFKIPDSLEFKSGHHVVSTRGDYEQTPHEEKINAILALDKRTRASSPAVKNCAVYYHDNLVNTLLVNSAGARVEKSIGCISGVIEVTAIEGGSAEEGQEVFSHVGCWNTIDEEALDVLADSAAAQAVRLLSAKPCPSGKFTIVVDNKLGGLFVHEAIGHACEADELLSGNSVLEGKLGKKVGNEVVTITDDGSVLGRFGYSPVDSEGIPGCRTVLIEKGVVTAFMHDLETATRMGAEPTGNGRAQSYDSVPIVRMTNTSLERGDWTRDELIADTRSGIYCQNWVYGYTEPEKGTFLFKCKEARIIEGGRLTNLVKGAALSGKILNILASIDAIADDFGESGGMCGKKGQSVGTSDGAPHFRVHNVVVGGSEE
ncbi:MAG: TldD/PmbA family protein [Candidatus Lokiarchaeota archaeon]|nr:TldD/PmbA family protein [Candidatus Lokiarchaeota archaeon]